MEQDAVVPLAEYPAAPFEDRHGVLWISTVFSGLLRYDGKEFTRFTVKDGLASEMLRGVHEGADGALYIATTGGVSKYDGKNFTTLDQYEGIVGVGDEPGFGGKGAHRDIWDIYTRRNGELWMTSLGGVFRYDGERFHRHPLPALKKERSFEFGQNMVYSMFEDRDGVLWFCTDGAGVIRDDGETQKVYTTKDGLASNFVCRIVQDGRGHYWFGTSNGGASHFDGKKFTTHLRYKEYSEAMGWGRVMGLHVDRKGSVWFGVAGDQGGVFRYNGESFQSYTEEDGLGAGQASSVSEDRSGNLWFGTTAGVYRYDGKRFSHFGRKP